jgi:multiple sugar transport system ATP-binding protein
MAEIILKNVNKTYASHRKEVQAVIDLNMTIKDGELVALLGPSGCGKSSTLRMIAGLEGVTSGDILIDGKRVNDLSPSERNVAMAFESYSLYPHMTVYKNMSFPLEVMNVGKAARGRKILDIAKVFHLEPFLRSRPPQLSGGQQQRVSLARALVRDPHVFLLDEPISHSDAHLRFQMRNEIKKLHYQLKATMIYVTHDQIDALSMADRIAVMNVAKLQQIGTRDELYDTPVNMFVAGFVGEPHINFLDCDVARSGETAVLRAGASKDLDIEISAKKARKVLEKNLRRVQVGVRPQNIFVNKTPGRVEVKGEVDYSEFIGEKAITVVKNGEVEFRMLTPTTMSVRKGDPIKGYIPDAAILIFDPSTGDAVY